MKLAGYSKPNNLDEAIRTISDLGGKSVILAGGTDLIPQLRIQEHTINCIVDIKAIPDLHELAFDNQRQLHVGGAITVHDIEINEGIFSTYPALIQAARCLGSYPVRCRATIGGNICRASPSGDLIPSLLLYDTKAHLYSSKGYRSVSLNEFFLSPGKTRLEDSEILVKFVIPLAPNNMSSKYFKYGPRKAMDLAIVSAAAAYYRDDIGNPQIRLALGAVGPRPFRLHMTEQDWNSGRLSTWEALSESAVKECQPISDIRASSEYRLHLARVLTGRIFQYLADDFERRTR